jgi:hypothetical protein
LYASEKSQEICVKKLNIDVYTEFDITVIWSESDRVAG